MALGLQTKVPATETQKNIYRTQSALAKGFNKVASGSCVNATANEATGLSTNESMKAQLRTYVVAERNTNDAIAMAQTAEGAMGEIHDVLERMRDLSTQASDGSTSEADRTNLQKDFSALQDEIKRLQDRTQFNDVRLLTPKETSVSIQDGLQAQDDLVITFGGLGLADILDTTVSGADPSFAQASLSSIDSAIVTVSQQRAILGAAMDRLDVVTHNNQTTRLNLSAAGSCVRDTDVAEGIAALSTTQILRQAGVSVLAQASQLPQLALGLLK